MASIKKPASFRAHKKTTLAMGVSAALMTPFNANAEEVFSLDALTIEERTADTNPYAEPNAPYKAKKSGDDRYKRDLADLPKNISVLTKTQIEDSGYTDLREILDAQPGITLGTGENGNAFGDRYIIRGQEARSDVFVDGLRDPGMTIRESFATEQVEITKGPDSSFGGRGTTGGAVNSVTKKATTDYDFNKLSVGVGTDNHQRITLDSNVAIDEKTAVRANILISSEDVPNRAPANNERNGLALSMTHKASDKLNVEVDYYSLDANGIPDLGSYMYDHDGDSATNKVPMENPPVYAQQGDFLKSKVDTATARFDLKITPDMKLSNMTRFGTTENGYLATGAKDSGTNATTGLREVNLSSHQGWQDVDYKANVTNLHVDKVIGGTKHEMLFGLEYTDHAVVNGVYDNASDRVGDVSEGYQINAAIDRSAVSKGDWDSDWRIKTTSLSAMDTFDLNEKTTLMAGVRADMYDFDLSTQGRSTGSYNDSQTVFNYHLAGSYKIRPDAMVYASYATSSDINGGESDVGTSSGYGGAAIDENDSMSADPEKTRSIELGAKWNIMDGKLLATAAIFDIDKTDVMEGSGYDSAGTFNTGGNHVKGVEFGVYGNLSPKLEVSAGLAIMKSEITATANGACTDASGAEVRGRGMNQSTCVSTAGNTWTTGVGIGEALANFADVTWSAQMKYQANRNWQLGLAAKYEGEKGVGMPDSAASTSLIIPSYTVFDAFANYRFNRNLNARLNLGNITNEQYHTAGYRSGSFLYLGDARNARLTLNYDF